MQVKTEYLFQLKQPKGQLLTSHNVFRIGIHFFPLFCLYRISRHVKKSTDKTSSIEISSLRFTSSHNST